MFTCNGYNQLKRTNVIKYTLPPNLKKNALGCSKLNFFGFHFCKLFNNIVII